MPLEVSPIKFKSALTPGKKLYRIDVREPHEYAIMKIEGAVLIPMRAIPAELQTLDARADEGPLLVYCHHGVRSLNVVNWLRNQGVEACQSISGGIDQWSTTVDPAIPRY